MDTATYRGATLPAPPPAVKWFCHGIKATRKKTWTQPRTGTHHPPFYRLSNGSVMASRPPSRLPLLNLPDQLPPSFRIQHGAFHILESPVGFFRTDMGQQGGNVVPAVNILLDTQRQLYGHNPMECGKEVY